MTVTVRESILTTIGLVRFRTLPQDSLVQIEVNHGFAKAEVEREVDLLVEDRTLVRNDGNLYLPWRPDEPIDPVHLETVDTYRRTHQVSHACRFLTHCFGIWWWKIWLTVLLLCGTVAGCMQMAHGQEIPTWVIRGIASQETGTHWNDTGDIDGRWARGTTGAVGPWHISLAVLSDLKLSAHADRIHRDPVYAESVTRLWLTHLHSVTGDWHQVCAAWRAGLWNRHRAWARAYAERAFNYGTTY